MQLDNTRIAIRERDLMETVDLALHVTREFVLPWLVCSLLAIVPLALINYALVGWMLPADLEDEPIPARYLWNMLVLIYLEAPLASTFVVAYLGPAVFLEKKTFREVLNDVLRYSPHIFLCQLLLRGVLPAWILLLTVDRFQFNFFSEGFLMTCIVLYATAMRVFRPYINEIVLLEKNPLRARNGTTITINKRSAHLHGPYSGDLFVRWMGAALVVTILGFVVLSSAVIIQGVLVNDWPVSFNMQPQSPDEVLVWHLDWFKLSIVYPLVIWLLAAFISVVRFLGYLDLRIRHEGWEVELLMRAEALRLAARME